MSRMYWRTVTAESPVFAAISWDAQPFARCWATRCSVGVRGVIGALVVTGGVTVSLSRLERTVTGVGAAGPRGDGDRRHRPVRGGRDSRGAAYGGSCGGRVGACPGGFGGEAFGPLDVVLVEGGVG